MIPSLSQQLLNVLICINKSIDDALSDHLLGKLSTHYTHPKTLLEMFRSMVDIRTYTSGELAKDIKAMKFSKETHVAASGKEYAIYTKNSLTMVTDQVCQDHESNLIVKELESASL